MTKRDSATVEVDFVFADFQNLHVCQCDDAESLVDLEGVYSRQIDLSMLQGLGHSKGGSGGELGWVLFGVAPAQNLGNGLQVVLLDGSFRRKDKSGCAVREGRGVGSRDGAVLGLEDRAQSTCLGLVELETWVDESMLPCHIGRGDKETYILGLVVSVYNDGWLATSNRDLDRGNLVLEPAGVVGGVGLLVGANAVLVLVLAGEAVVVGTLLALQAHVLLLVGIGEAVLEHTIDQRLVAELGAVAHGGEVVRGVGHALGAGGDDDVGIARDDGLGADNQGLDRRGADLVDGGCDRRLGQASANGTLAGGVLAETGATQSVWMRPRQCRGQ